MMKSSKKTSILDFDNITQNLITLYFDKPNHIEEIFCDNIGEMVPVRAVGDGVFKVEFAKSKYNIFHYKNGKCTKIEAFSTLFNVTLIPIQS